MKESECGRSDDLGKRRGVGVKVWGDGGRLQEPRSMAGPGSCGLSCCVPLLHSLHAPNSTQKHPEIGHHLASTLSLCLVIVCEGSAIARLVPRNVVEIAGADAEERSMCYTHLQL